MKNNMIQPQNNYILVDIIKDDGTEGGVIIHNKDNVVAETGKILKVPEAFKDTYKEGMIVYFKTYSLVTVPKTKYNEELNFVIADEILAVSS
jgi:co-chaperonin GroES (HSP10)